MGPPVDMTKSQENSSGPDHASPFSEMATTEKEDVKTTTDKKEKNDVTSEKTTVNANKRVQGDYGDLQDQNAKEQRVITTRSKKRMQGEDGDPHERKKQRISARVRFSLPTQKRRAMDGECDVSCAKRRKFATNAESGGEMEDLQWIEHEKRMFRLEMLAEAKQYNDMVRFHQTLWKTSQGQPHGAQQPSVSQTNTTYPPVVTPADATAMENDCAPPIIPTVIESANETTCPPIIPVVVKSAKETTTSPPPIIPVVVESAKETTSPPPIIPVLVKSAKEMSCHPSIIPVAMKSAKETTRPPIVPVVDASAKRRRH
ncbi:hypothetical protein AC1031_015325 [Aphanomyces cochlioides]|nr:hypothetical protein AC1031_015325 [Aphanomyces cochlioides]